VHTSCGGDPIQEGDTWLSANVPTIMGSAAYRAGAVVITWDERAGSGKSSDGPRGLLVLLPFGKRGYTNSIRYNHGAMLCTLEEAF